MTHGFAAGFRRALVVGCVLLSTEVHLAAQSNPIGNSSTSTSSFRGQTFPNIRIKWESVELQSAEHRAPFVELMRREGKPLVQGSLKLRKQHELLKAGDQIRYECRGDTMVTTSSTGLAVAHVVWVYNTTSGTTRWLEYAGQHREFNYGKIYKDMFFGPSLDTSLAPLLAWLSHASPTTNPVELKLPGGGQEPKPTMFTKDPGTGDEIVEWGLPRNDSIPSAANRLRQRSQMQFSKIDRGAVPKTWTFNASVGNRVRCCSTSAVTYVEFPKNVAAAEFDLEFPPNTLFFDNSVTPRMVCVIDSKGDKRGTMDEHMFFDVKEADRFSTRSKLPLIRERSSARLTMLLCSSAVVGVSFLLVNKWRQQKRQG